MSNRGSETGNFFRVVDDVFPGNLFQRRRVLDEFQLVRNVRLTNSQAKEINQKLKNLKRVYPKFTFRYAIPNIVVSAKSGEDLSRLLAGLKPFFDQFSKCADLRNEGRGKKEENIETPSDDETACWMEIEYEIQWEAIPWADLIRDMERIVETGAGFDIEFSPYKTYTRVERTPGNLNDYNDPLYWTSSHSEGETSQSIRVVPIKEEI